MVKKTAASSSLSVCDAREVASALRPLPGVLTRQPHSGRIELVRDHLGHSALVDMVLNDRRYLPGALWNLVFSEDGRGAVVRVVDGEDEVRLVEDIMPRDLAHDASGVPRVIKGADTIGTVLSELKTTYRHGIVSMRMGAAAVGVGNTRGHVHEPHSLSS